MCQFVKIDFEGKYIKKKLQALPKNVSLSEVILIGVLLEVALWILCYTTVCVIVKLS